MSVITQHSMFKPVGGLLDSVDTPLIEGRGEHRVSGIVLAVVASGALWGLIAVGIGSGFAMMTR